MDQALWIWIRTSSILCTDEIANALTIQRCSLLTLPHSLLLAAEGNLEIGVGWILCVVRLAACFRVRLRVLPAR